RAELVWSEALQQRQGPDLFDAHCAVALEAEEQPLLQALHRADRVQRPRLDDRLVDGGYDARLELVHLAWRHARLRQNLADLFDRVVAYLDGDLLGGVLGVELGGLPSMLPNFGVGVAHHRKGVLIHVSEYGLELLHTGGYLLCASLRLLCL